MGVTYTTTSAATYVPIATTTLGSAAASYTFSSIPSTYTDLVLVINGGTVTASRDMYAQFNSDTGTNYSQTFIRGDGTAASSSKFASQSNGWLDFNGANNDLNQMWTAHIMNYSNTTTYKTYLSRFSRASAATEAIVGLWKNTAAISTILVGASSGNILANTTLSLYGILGA
jgi:hypothetical protein